MVVVTELNYYFMPWYELAFVLAFDLQQVPCSGDVFLVFFSNLTLARYRMQADTFLCARAWHCQVRCVPLIQSLIQRDQANRRLRRAKISI